MKASFVLAEGFLDAWIWCDNSAFFPWLSSGFHFLQNSFKLMARDCCEGKRPESIRRVMINSHNQSYSLSLSVKHHWLLDSHVLAKCDHPASHLKLLSPSCHRNQHRQLRSSTSSRACIIRQPGISRKFFSYISNFLFQVFICEPINLTPQS